MISSRAAGVRLKLIATRLCIGVSTVAIAFLTLDVGEIFWLRLRGGQWTESLAQAAFILILAVLLYGNLVYQLARLGYLIRLREFQERDRDSPPGSHNTRLTVLVPAYREEVPVVRMTLLSAALLDHGDTHVVLLIDDPPGVASNAATSALEALRALPRELMTLLAEPVERFEAEHSEFLQREQRGLLDFGAEIERLTKLYGEAGQWLLGIEIDGEIDDHARACFVREVLEHGVGEFEKCVQKLRQTPQTLESLASQYAALAARFRVNVSSFERKLYVNLPHIPNKAMNLNAYLALLGGSFLETQRKDGLHLEPARRSQASLTVPDADYVLTLDADSLLRSDYARRLLDVIESPAHARVAVIQTPYSAFPGATKRLERIAAATTDIQYFIHQGFTHFGATYWVGANALIRVQALREIRQLTQERGYTVSRFISDNTVIEDTESSVDLLQQGWKLHNYPERMAFSATPPDFGSLAIQRARWANGGLLIFPKLLSYLRTRIWTAEGWMRCHYLISIAGVNVALMALLLIPFDQAQRSWWLPLAAAPYFALYAADLRSIGYRATDVIGVYALNLLLIPVNLEGVWQSLRQAMFGTKVGFRRTPKVTRRTPTEPRHLLFHALLLAGLCATLAFDIERGLWVHASFVTINGGILVYALCSFIGVDECKADLMRAASAGAASQAATGDSS